MGPQFSICLCITALEKLLKDFSGQYALGDEVYMARFKIFSNFLLFKISIFEISLSWS